MTPNSKNASVGPRPAAMTIAKSAMYIDVRDPNVIRALRPLEVVAYLRSRGWAQQPATSTKASTWTIAVEKDEFEAMVPLDEALRDYALRMAEVLQAVSAVEGRPPVQVYVDLLGKRIDNQELVDEVRRLL